MADQEKTFTKWQASGPTFPWRQLLLGALMPVALFYALARMGRPLTGALTAIGWSTALIFFQHRRKRKVELFPALAIPIVLIELIGILITRNPNFYLASAAIENLLWAVLFAGSLVLHRPLIQVFAELLNPGLGSDEFLRFSRIPQQLYRSAWRILTAVWAAVNLIKAIVLIVSQLKLPLETFLIVRTASGLPVLVLLLMLSYRFPGWYWARARHKTDDT